MDNHQNSLRYERLYYVWSHRMEKRFLKLIAVLCLLLILYQLLLQIPYLRNKMTIIDHMEGTPIQTQISTWQQNN